MWKTTWWIMENRYHFKQHWPETWVAVYSNFIFFDPAYFFVLLNTKSRTCILNQLVMGWDTVGVCASASCWGGQPTNYLSCVLLGQIERNPALTYRRSGGDGTHHAGFTIKCAAIVLGRKNLSEPQISLMEDGAQGRC